MPFALHREIVNALGPDAPDVSPVLATLMQCKHPRELTAIRRACATLDAAMAAIREAQRSAATAAHAVLAGEHAAIRRGAQDVRCLFSTDGGRAFRPFEGAGTQAVPVDPLQVYVAVRESGYWAEGFAAFGQAPAVAAACAALRSVIADARPGVSGGTLGAAIADAIKPYSVHPIARCFANAIGLALEEAPTFTAGNEATLQAGNVYSLRVGLADPDRSAVVSAMVLVGREGSETLWSACGAGEA
jgi:Xaa-Pro aminopeptidase